MISGGGTAIDGPHYEVHIAFTAPDRSMVDRVYRAAVAAHANILHPFGVARVHRSYYGVFLRDHDGNTVEAVCHG